MKRPAHQAKALSPAVGWLRRVSPAVGVLAAFLFAGCTTPASIVSTATMPSPINPGDVLGTSTPLISTLSPDQTEQATQVAPSAAAPDPVSEAKNALAAYLSVNADEVSLVSAVPVQWNDSSLGCPQQGAAYTQVITPGYLITLEVSGTQYDVHTDLNGATVVCTDNGDPIGSQTVADPIAAEFISQARAQLSEQLGVPPEEIALVRSESFDWSDSSLGCVPPEGEEVVAGATSGYRIILAYGSTRYEYHTNQQRMIFCEQPTE